MLYGANYHEHANMKKRLLLASRLALLALSLALLWHLVDIRVVADCIGSIPLPVIVILMAVNLFRAWMTAVRWQWVNPDESKQLSSWQYFRLMMMAKPFNLIMPGALGGDFVRTAITLKTVKSNRVNNVIAIAADRFVGLLSITVLGVIALFFMSDIPDKRAFYCLFGLLTGGFVVILLVISNAWLLRLLESVFSRLGGLGKRLVHVLETWKKALLFFKCNYKRLLQAFLLCLPIHGLSFLTSYILAKILGMEVSFFDISLILALVWVITAVPITISGLGVRELSLIYFFSLYGVGAEAATALSVYLYVVSVAMGLIGLVFLFVGHKPGEINNEGVG